MTDAGITPYAGLAGNWCEECGQAKSYRLWPGMLTGCATCDEVITRHRCAGRPDLGALDVGASWECPDCGTVWSVAEREDTCGECGRSGMVKAWSHVPGDRIDSAPRYQPQPFTPFRDKLPGAAR